LIQGYIRCGTINKRFKAGKKKTFKERRKLKKKRMEIENI
jgi:hypothetical protein